MNHYWELIIKNKGDLMTTAQINIVDQPQHECVGKGNQGFEAVASVFSSLSICRTGKYHQRTHHYFYSYAENTQLFTSLRPNDINPIDKLV